MKIIDWDRKGNVVRFYCGADDCNDYWGDDWKDIPYEHNAGTVYNEYVIAVIDIVVPFDYDIEEPADRCGLNSPYSKAYFKETNFPIITIWNHEIGICEASFYMNESVPIDDIRQHNTWGEYRVIDYRRFD